MHVPSRTSSNLSPFYQDKNRSRVGLIVESGEPRELHQFCSLMGYGVDAVCPYLAYEAIYALQKDGKLPASTPPDVLIKSFIKSIGYGLLKVKGKGCCDKDNWPPRRMPVKAS